MTASICATAGCDSPVYDDVSDYYPGPSAHCHQCFWALEMFHGERWGDYFNGTPQQWLDSQRKGKSE